MWMTLAGHQRAAKAFKKKVDRRFQRFKGYVQEVIERGRYDEEDYKIDKRSEERHRGVY